MKRLIALLAFFAGPVFADELPRYDWKVLRVIDGDTVEIEAPYLPAPLAPKLSIRVYGVDTPEKGWRGQCDKERALGESATDFTKQLVNYADVIQVEIRQWDKFGGRVLGDLWVDGKSLTAMLVENGFARPYFGDKKKSWCEE